MAQIDSKKDYYFAVGRRKTAIASVKLVSGTGIYTRNKETAELTSDLLKPMQLTDLVGKFDVTAKVLGGGKISQLEAIRLGIARALVKFNPELRVTLKKSGLLTRDPREKERKKYGLKRARKAPQWSKR
jgi:small subunit ribosomal protein S9